MQLMAYMVAFRELLTSPETIFGGAAVLTLLGIHLCWRAPHFRMSAEERAKDGKLTEDQARWRIRVVSWWGPALTFAGLLLMWIAMIQQR